MGKLELGFAVGAIAFAAIVGGLLYALYPNNFGGLTTASDAMSTASNTYTGVDGMTSTAADNSTASQNAASTSADNATSPQPSSNSGY